jgi:hypothetical protein
VAAPSLAAGWSEIIVERGAQRVAHGERSRCHRCMPTAFLLDPDMVLAANFGFTSICRCVTREPDKTMALRLKNWLTDFCAAHELFKKGELASDQLAAYEAAREDLGLVLVVAQRLEIRAGGARQALRVARAIPVEFELPAGKVAALTQDISVGGLSALVGESPAVGSELPFRLKLGREVGPVAGRCRVVGARPKQGSVCMAVAFEDIGPEARQSIENMVFDAIAAEIRTTLPRS